MITIKAVSPFFLQNSFPVRGKGSSLFLPQIRRDRYDGTSYVLHRDTLGITEGPLC